MEEQATNGTRLNLGDISRGFRETDAASRAMDELSAATRQASESLEHAQQHHIAMERAELALEAYSHYISGVSRETGLISREECRLVILAALGLSEPDEEPPTLNVSVTTNVTVSEG